MPKSATRPTKRPSPRASTSEARPRLIPVTEAAKRLGVSKRTVHRIRHELRYTRVGHQILIHEDALERYVARNTFGAGAE